MKLTRLIWIFCAIYCLSIFLYSLYKAYKYDLTLFVDHGYLLACIYALVIAYFTNKEKEKVEINIGNNKILVDKELIESLNKPKNSEVNLN